MDVSFFSAKEHPQMVFVLGGPGSGKSEQCERLVRDLKFSHISVGSLMREEVEKKTKEGQELEAILKKGEVASSELAVRILAKEMKARKARKFLIDGFPRTLDNALYFEQNCGDINFLLNLECPDEILIDRVLKRASQEGRYDDNKETLEKRLEVYHKETNEVLNFYSRYGEVVNVPAHGTIEETYFRTRKALLPNLFFFYGPPAGGQEQLAENYAHLTGYKLIKVHEFYAEHNILNANDEIKMEILIAYLRDHHQKNFILHGFPENIRQVKILCEHFTPPNKFYYFDFSKDQVEDHIKDLPKQQREKILVEYDIYVKNRKDILPYFNKKPYFVRIQEKETKEELWQSLAETVAPEIIACPHIPDDDLSINFVRRLGQERGYVYVDIVGLVKDEISRGIELGRRLSNTVKSGRDFSSHLFALAKKVLYTDPARKKFILAGFPHDISSLGNFEANCCKVKHVLAFVNKPLEFKEGNLYSVYHAKGKLIKMNGDNLDKFDDYVLDRCRYGFLIGPESAGRPAVAAYLKANYATQLIDFNQTAEFLKTKLATEDNPDVEVKFSDILNYFKEEIGSKDRSHNILFDGWPYEKDQLTTFMKTIGAPTYVFWLNASEELLGNKYKIENKAETVDEGEQEKINEEVAKSKQLAQVFYDFIGQGNNVNLFDVKVALTIEATIKVISNIIFKRVLVFKNLSGKYQGQDVKDLMVNACISNDVTFVDVIDLIKKHLALKDDLGKKLEAQTKMVESEKEKLNPSLFAPTLITDLINKSLQTQPSTKYLLLYNYPSADSREDGNFFPRAIDELHQIELSVGPVRQIISMQDHPESYEINDPIEERPVQEEEVKKEVKVVEGGEEEAAEANEPPKEEEEGKPKFNPLDYEWTVSDAHPKSLNKVYHRRVNCEHIDHELKAQNMDNLIHVLRDSIERLEQEENKDKDYYLQVVLS